MTLLLGIAGVALLAWISQLWDERERAKDAGLVAAALQETEAMCRDQHAKQAAHVEGYAPDPRSAGKPVAPRAETRNRTKRAA
jgi:hypothetical protein